MNPARLLSRVLVAAALFASPAAVPAATPVPATPNASPPSSDPKPPEVSPEEIFTALCRALRENYPMLELTGWKEAWVQEFSTRLRAAPDRAAAFALMEELVCRLNDYHTRLSWPGRPRLLAPLLDAEPVLLSADNNGPRAVWDERPPLEMPSLHGLTIAVTFAPAGSEAQVGDEILAIDGLPVAEALAQSWRRAVGSSAAGKLRSALDRALAGPPSTTLRLQVRRGSNPPAGETAAITAPRGRRPVEDQLSSREVEGVPVLRISHWGTREGTGLRDRFDAELERWRNRPGLILDVRGNGGGSDGLAEEVMGRFLRAPVIASISFQRRVPEQTFGRFVSMAKPRGPWSYEGRVAVLTDEGSMSACEHFVSGMIEAGALACGTPTSGACGWIRTVELPGGVRLNVSRTYPLHTGGIPSPLLGIPPHLWAPRTLADVRAGRDTALAAALRWVQGTAPLPLRLQPVAPLSR
ncbi:MAG: hypothetical protein HZC55_24840 [Verrucomicrobia bacterium]|nr:hypothetical protein [Verrucomicrobiota bacterium]